MSTSHNTVTSGNWTDIKKRNLSISSNSEPPTSPQVYTNKNKKNCSLHQTDLMYLDQMKQPMKISPRMNHNSLIQPQIILQSNHRLQYLLKESKIFLANVLH